MPVVKGPNTNDQILTIFHYFCTRVCLYFTSGSRRNYATHKMHDAWAQHVERVESCHVETWRAKWNLG